MKKYSDMFNYTQILSYAIVGIEFEFFSQHSYYKMLELLNKKLSPIKVHGFKEYHSDFTPDSMNFKIEPDRSGGSSMVELVTGPMAYTNAKIILLQILKFIQEHGMTNDKCAIHMNISFNKDVTDKNIINLNTLKMILNFDEDYVYKFFPNRQNNIYAKSIKNLVPFKDYSYVTDAITLVQNNFQTPDKKYYGINFSHLNNLEDGQRLEFRYCGGEDYEYKTTELLELLEYFIKESWMNCSIPLDGGDIEKLKTYLNKNIQDYKNFSTLQQFMTGQPKIDLQVNGSNNYDYVNSYFIEFKDKLFDLFNATDKLDKCTINYVSASGDIEIIEAKVKTILDIKDFTFIDCEIKDSMLNECTIVFGSVQNSHLNTSKVFGSDLTNCRLYNTDIDKDSTLTECYYNGGTLDGIMNAGIFRAGKIGPNGELSSSTKIIKVAAEDFFGVKQKGTEIKKKI